MLHPSYSDLMKVVNSEVEPGEEKIVNSRYSIVMATAKRARQIIGGHEPMVKVKPGEKPLSIAVDEAQSGQDQDPRRGRGRRLNLLERNNICRFYLYPWVAIRTWWTRK